jgi:hypothetical protein
MIFLERTTATLSTATPRASQFAVPARASLRESPVAPLQRHTPLSTSTHTNTTYPQLSGQESRTEAPASIGHYLVLE